MKLATKLVSMLVIAVTAMLALEAYVSVQRDLEMFENDMRRDANQLGRTLKDLTEDVWRANGEQRAIQLIDEANDEEMLVSVRWVWLDDNAADTYRPQTPMEELAAVLEGTPVTLPGRDQSGRAFLFSYFPLALPGSRPAALELGRSLDGLDKFRRDSIIGGALLVIGIVAGGVIVVAVLGVTFIGQPLNMLLQKTRRVGAGDLSGPLELRGHDELTELATALNQMCDQLAEASNELETETEARIAALEQLRHADRLATVGRLAAGVAHELGTPMNVVSARATMILENHEVEESARIIKAQIKKMTMIIRQLLDSARKQKPKTSMQDAKQLVEQVVELFAPMAIKRNAQISVASSDDDFAIRLDAGQFQQVVTNLLENAIHAIPDGGQVEVSVACLDAQPPAGSDAAAGRYVRVDVQDQGKGIDKEIIKHVFDPFVTTKDVGEGTGLGLSIVYGIIRDHGGWVDVQSEPGMGTCFSVFLPKSL